MLLCAWSKSMLVSYYGVNSTLDGNPSDIGALRNRSIAYTEGEPFMASCSL